LVFSDKKKNHCLDMQNNVYLNYEGFALNWLYHATVGDAVKVLNRKLFLGYQKGAHSAVFALSAKKKWQKRNPR